MAAKIISCQIVEYQGREKSCGEENLVYEYPLTIFLNGQELVTLLCSQEQADALALGFLRTEGLISSYDDIVSRRFDQSRGVIEITTKQEGQLSERLYSKRLIPTGCGSCGKGGLFYNIIDSLKCRSVVSEISLSPEQVYDFMSQTLNYSKTYRVTGGVHSAALFDNSKMLVAAEDIARHNAMDKVIGLALLDKIDFQDKIIAVSGRISSEMLLKTAKLQIPIIISKSAPTHLAVELARELKVTAIGFVRGEKMTIFSAEERIK